MIAEIACYAFVAYLEHKKKLDLIDRGLWKPEEKQEKPVHKQKDAYVRLTRIITNTAAKNPTNVQTNPAPDSLAVLVVVFAVAAVAVV